MKDKELETKGSVHYHKDEKGEFVKCLHECKNIVLTPSFWLLTTITFPFEHFIWERLPPFNWLTKLLGV